MPQFTSYQRFRGILSLLKAESIERFAARYDPPPDADVSGKTILITGATSGIGKVTARRLALCGANLIITARDEKRGQKCVEELIEQTGNSRIELIYMDLGDLDSVRKAAAQILREKGRLDILVNCAAKGRCDPPVITIDGHEEMMQVNSLAPYLFTFKLLPLLKSSGTPESPARIIFVASEGHYACPSFTFDEIDHPERFVNLQEQYLLSKFLCVLSAMYLANKLQDENVVVHSLCPGTTRTEFWDRWPESSQMAIDFMAKVGFVRSVEQAASNVILVTSGEEAGKCTGVYWANMGKRSALSQCYDKKFQEEIMGQTNELLNIKWQGD